ncbi:alpha/beta fold hydrolase [Nocardioides convexus]|uniref:alpha/beta hydrolase n=1 Tax=Nocardioides convexus TaxID=2712224 RepID=UPI0024189DFC|nr:alpha/beta fold hydrolase [Nocardioides convexus]
MAADGVGVAVIRYAVRGWNAAPDREPSPVPDARWALDTLRREHDLPFVLVGHSMGARTGVAVADEPGVVGVVALAPWLPADEPVEPLKGKVLRAAHGRRDKITSARATRRYVERAAEVADAGFTDMGGLGHYLLRGVPRWNAFAVAGVRESARLSRRALRRRPPGSSLTERVSRSSHTRGEPARASYDAAWRQARTYPIRHRCSAGSAAPVRPRARR